MLGTLILVKKPVGARRLPTRAAGPYPAGRGGAVRAAEFVNLPG
jgi:hypothetical protein